MTLWPFSAPTVVPLIGKLEMALAFVTTSFVAIVLMAIVGGVVSICKVPAVVATGRAGHIGIVKDASSIVPPLRLRDDTVRSDVFCPAATVS